MTYLFTSFPFVASSILIWFTEKHRICFSDVTFMQDFAFENKSKRGAPPILHITVRKSCLALQKQTKKSKMPSEALDEPLKLKKLSWRRHCNDSHQGVWTKTWCWLCCGKWRIQCFGVFVFLFLYFRVPEFWLLECPFIFHSSCYQDQFYSCTNSISWVSKSTNLMTGL